MASYTIRPATLRDAKTIANIHTSVQDTVYNELVPVGYAKGTEPAESSLVFWREAIEYGEPQVQVAVDEDSKIIGFVGFDRSRDKGTKPTVGEIWALHVLPSHWNTGAGASRWVIMMDQAGRPDITIAARLASANNGIRDYYLLPSIDVAAGKLRLAEANGTCLDGYRFDDLSHFFTLAQRTQVGREF